MGEGVSGAQGFERVCGGPRHRPGSFWKKMSDLRPLRAYPSPIPPSAPPFCFLLTPPVEPRGRKIIRMHPARSLALTPELSAGPVSRKVEVSAATDRVTTKRITLPAGELDFSVVVRHGESRAGADHVFLTRL